MITPELITNFNRSTTELEEFLLFGICVAGKKSSEVAPKINSFCDSLCDADDEPLSPFEGIRQLVWADLLEERLREFRLGCYNDLIRAFWDILFLDLRTCTVEDLEACHGIGPKTSRFFVLHSRPNQKHIVLDTHLLKWVRSVGIEAPKSTPTTMKSYLRIEARVIEFLGNKVKDFADFDLTKWSFYAKTL